MGFLDLSFIMRCNYCNNLCLITLESSQSRKIVGTAVRIRLRKMLAMMNLLEVARVMQGL